MKKESTPRGLSLPAKLSALLFVSTKPITLQKLCAATGEEAEAVEAALASLQETFVDEQHGFSLVEVAGGWQFRSSPEASRVIEKLIPPKARRLSRAAAETLAVVAYRQPVPRSEVESIRGVDALPTLRTLLDARLIRVVGRDKSPGHPALYGTTQEFLEKFGLRDLSELPSAREIEELMQDPGEPEAQAGADAEGDTPELEQSNVDAAELDQADLEPDSDTSPDTSPDTMPSAETEDAGVFGEDERAA